MILSRTLENTLYNHFTLAGVVVNFSLDVTVYDKEQSQLC